MEAIGVSAAALHSSAWTPSSSGGPWPELWREGALVGARREAFERDRFRWRGGWQERSHRRHGERSAATAASAKGI
jgi:hypothetical protein